MGDVAFKLKFSSTELRTMPLKHLFKWHKQALRFDQHVEEEA